MSKATRIGLNINLKKSNLTLIVFSLFFAFSSKSYSQSAKIESIIPVICINWSTTQKAYSATDNEYDIHKLIEANTNEGISTKSTAKYTDKRIIREDLTKPDSCQHIVLLKGQLMEKVYKIKYKDEYKKMIKDWKKDLRAKKQDSISDSDRSILNEMSVKNKRIKIFGTAYLFALTTNKIQMLNSSGNAFAAGPIPPFGGTGF